MRDFTIHSGRLACGAVDHVGGEVREEEEQGRAEQPLHRPEAAAENAVERPERGRAPSLRAESVREQLYDEEA